MSGHRGALRRAAVAAGVAGLLATVAGCATLPPAGRIKPNRLPGISGPSQQGVVQTMPVGPGGTRRWPPAAIVRGFMFASAAFTSDPEVRVAREFLAPGYRNSWKPKAAGWAATVVDDSASIAVSPLSQHVNGETNTSRVVDVTSPSVATLYTGGRRQAGQYLVSTAQKPLSFGLILTPQGWRINNLPWPTLLLLTRADFLHDYQPRNLYFIAANSPRRLLPDPVFIPQLPGAGGTATGLVEGLIPHGNQELPGATDRLSGAATTAFPLGTQLLGVQVNGSQATVDLGGTAVRASQAQRQQMAAQLVWSLTSQSYGTPTAIRSVIMQLDHRNWRPPGQLLPSFEDAYQAWVPVTPYATVYYQRTAPGQPPQIRMQSKDLSGAATVMLSDNLGRGPLTALAVSPGPAASEVLAACRGRTVYLARLIHARLLRKQSLPGRCTSLTWDRQDDLWVTTRTGPYVLPPPARAGGARQVRLVVSPAPTLQPPQSLNTLRIAPDGVRAAMIVTRGNADRLLVSDILTHAGSYYLAPGTQTATVGSDIHGRLIALSWWDPDHLLVVAQSAKSAEPKLYDVPLNGGLSAQVPAPPAGTRWLAVTGTTVVAGTAPRRGFSFGRIWKMSGLSGSWRPVTDGTMPVVPG